MDLLGKSALLWSCLLCAGPVGCDKKEDEAEAAKTAPTEAPPVAEVKKPDPPQPDPSGPGQAPTPIDPSGAEPSDLEGGAPEPDDPSKLDEVPTGTEPELGRADDGALAVARPMPPDPEDDGAPDWGVSFMPDQGTLILSFDADKAASDTPKWCRDPERVLDQVEAAVKEHEECSVEKKFSLQQGGGFSYVCHSTLPDKPSCALSFSARLKIKRRSNSEVNYKIFGTADITRECSGSETPFEPKREDIAAASTRRATQRLEEIMDQCGNKAPFG